MDSLSLAISSALSAAVLVATRQPINLPLTPRDRLFLLGLPLCLIGMTGGLSFYGFQKLSGVQSLRETHSVYLWLMHDGPPPLSFLRRT